MNGYGRFVLPIAVAVTALATLALCTGPGKDPTSGPHQGMHLHEFGMLPILDRGSGRTKPFGSAARTKLMLISGRQEFTDDNKQTHSAVEWMLDVLTSRPPFRNQAAQDHKVFRIDNDQVLAMLGLEARPGSYRYSLAEMGPKQEEYQKAVDAVRAKRQQDLPLDTFEQKLGELDDHMQVFLTLAAWQTPLMVNPENPNKPPSLAEAFSDWATTADEAIKQKQSLPPQPPFLTLLAAYDRGDAQTFNDALDAYQKQLEVTMPAVTHRAAFEAAFDDFAPFFWCTIFYVGVFLLTCAAWGCYALERPDWARTLNWSALTLGALTLVVHTGALIARMYMMQRPFVFVTNLYGTAIFIGWVAAILGLVFQLIFRNGVGNIVMATAGFVTMIIAQFLSMGEDTMEMMRAVLDTNFWLATHVTSVNIGYAGTMVAGILGAVYILWGLLTSTMNKASVKMMGDALYGVVCFATLFSFTGTVLGGIWADQSWGRFWGWDPKENGALLIVVWNALILHARWGGLVKVRGMAVLALFGNIIVIWSWWGVNMLGVGLHAYANADSAMLTTVLSAVGVHVLLIGMGLIPTHLWASFAPQPLLEAVPVAPPQAPNGRRRRGKSGTGVATKPA